MVCTCLLLLAAIGTALASTCDPLCPQVCSYPFPNDFWRANGKLAFTRDTFPKDRSGQDINVDMGGWNQLGNGLSLFRKGNMLLMQWQMDFHQ